MADRVANPITSMESATVNQLKRTPTWVWVVVAGGAILIAGIAAVVIAMQYSRKSHA